MLPLIKTDKNLFHENILIPQEKIKKLKSEAKNLEQDDIKPWMKKI